MPIARDNPFDAFLPELPSGGAPPPAPAPSGGGYASYRDPVTGQPVLAPVANAPVGIPYRLSAGVDQTTGRTPQGDVFNPFRGYVGPQGGTFGGYDSIVDPTTGMTGKQYDERVKRALDAFGPIDWTKVDRARVINTTGTIADLNRIDEWRLAAALGGALDETQKAILLISRDPTINPFRSRADAMRLGINFETGAALDPNLDYYDRAVATGVMTPEQAATARNFPTEFVARQNAIAALAARVNPDPWGRFDSPTAASHVITPASVAAYNAARSAFENFRPSAPQPGATMPTTPPNPFQPFAAAPPPAPTDMGGMKPASAPALAPGALPPGVAPANVPFANIPAPDLGGGSPGGAPLTMNTGVAPFTGTMPIEQFDQPLNTGPVQAIPFTAAPYAAGGRPPTSPAGITASGGYPGIMGRRYAMAGLNRFRKPGAGGPQFGVQQNGFLGGAGGAGQY